MSACVQIAVEEGVFPVRDLSPVDASSGEFGYSNLQILFGPTTLRAASLHDGQWLRFNFSAPFVFQSADNHFLVEITTAQPAPGANYTLQEQDGRLGYRHVLATRALHWFGASGGEAYPFSFSIPTGYPWPNLEASIRWTLLCSLPVFLTAQSLYIVPMLRLVTTNSQVMQQPVRSLAVCISH